MVCAAWYKKNQDFAKCPLFLGILAHASARKNAEFYAEYNADCQVMPSKNADCQVMPVKSRH